MNRHAVSTLLRLPLAAVLLGLVAIPLGFLAVFSVFRQSPLLEPVPALTAANYGDFLANPSSSIVVTNTILIAVPTAIAVVVCGFVLAYFIVFRARRSKSILLAGVVVCYMGSFLAYIYSWRSISGHEGLVNALLQGIGLTDAPLAWILFSRFAVILAETQFFLPFATLVIYSALTQISPNVIAAARDLGAPPWQVMTRVVIPISGRASFGVGVFALFLSAGDYITPVFLGGASNSITIGTTITDAITSGLNYPLGSAIGFLMLTGLAGLAGVLWLVMRWIRILPKVSA